MQRCLLQPVAVAPAVPAEPAVDVYVRPAVLKGIPKEIILYQYEVCPFCCKVKAFLDYHKVCQQHHVLACFAKC